MSPICTTGSFTTLSQAVFSALPGSLQHTIHPNPANLFHGRSPLSEINYDLILAQSMPSGAVHTNSKCAGHGAAPTYCFRPRSIASWQRATWIHDRSDGQRTQEELSPR